MIYISPVYVSDDVMKGINVGIMILGHHFPNGKSCDHNITVIL